MEQQLSILDAHAHFTTPEYLAMMERHSASLEDGFPLPDWSVSQTFRTYGGVQMSNIITKSEPLYVKLSGKELLQKLKSSRTHAKQGNYKEANEVIRDMRTKYRI